MAPLPDGISMDIPDLRVTITPRSEYVVKIQAVDAYHVITFDTPTVTRQTSVFVDYAQSSSYTNYADSASYAEISATSSYADNFNVAGAVTASTFSGDGSLLTGLTAVGAGVVVNDDGTLRGVSQMLDFVDGLDVSFVASTSSISLNRTGSFSGDGSGLTNIVSASFATTSSYVNNLQQIVTVTGSVDVTGSVTTETMILRKEDQRVLFDSIITRNVYAETRQIEPLIPTGSYSGCQIEYHATKTSSTRQGMVLGTWLNGQINYTDISNLGIGDSDTLSFDMILSNGHAMLRAVSSGVDAEPWSIHTFLKTFSNIV